MNLKLDTSHLVNTTREEILSNYGLMIPEVLKKLSDGSATGSEMTGWIEWINRDHSQLIQKASELRDLWLGKGVKAVVVIGTGGSYIGCKAALDFDNSFFKKKNFDFIFVPYFSERYLSELTETLKNTKFSILVISKSGTTLESAVAFRLIRELLSEKEGSSYRDYVAAITDKSKGILRRLVDKEGIFSFTIEDDIGGRYSTLTAVGIVPMVLGGVDAEAVLNGARKAYKNHFDNPLNEDAPGVYALTRYSLFKDFGLVSECFACYDPHLNFCLEKAKQLFSESEGKNGKGIMPIILNLTPDLHSVGQLLQDGNKSFFETTLLVKNPKYQSRVEQSSFKNDDNLDWLAGKSFKEINEAAFKGTLDAHVNEGKVNNIVITLDSWDPENFGYFYYWLSLAAMYSSYFFGVNPFNQPGVEIYKKRMFELLGKA